MQNKKKDEDLKAFLGKGAEFTGKLIFKGTVRIDGNFDGEIFGDGTLVIGEGAYTEANITVDSALISGKVCGQITVRERIEIYPPGHVFGNINTPTLVIKEGGIFEGKSHMLSEKTEPF
jgi:cytoskeletal protein CcmA (bactofilin family)